MAINKQRPFKIMAYTDGQVDITNDLIVLNVQQFMPESIMWSGFTENQIQKIKADYAHWLLEIINREVRAEQERG